MDEFDDKYKKKNPFSVPDGYFDSFTDKVMNKVEIPEKEGKMRFMQIVKPYFGLVGIFVIALVVVQLIFPLFIDENKMLVKQGNSVVQVKEVNEEMEVFDSDFNPTNEEIIEYLALEVSHYELFFADLY